MAVRSNLPTPPPNIPHDHPATPILTRCPIVGELLTSFTEEAALNILAAEFTDTSSSINFLSGQPLDGVTFPARQAFIQGQGSQPPIGFEVLGIDAVTCQKDTTDSGVIAFRWKATVGANKTGGAKGINILYVSKGTEEGQEGVDGWVIDDVYSEFNNAVWAIEFGGTCSVPSGPPTLKRS